MQERERLYQSIGECFKERVAATPDHIAVEFQGQTLTWSQLDILSDWLVLRFHFFGMKAGSRAAIWCGNHLQWIIVFLGLQKIGAVAVLINPGYQVDEFYKILAYTQVEYLFYGETYKNTKMTDVLEQIDLTEHPYLKQTIPIELQDAIDFMCHGAEAMTAEDREQAANLGRKIKPRDTACMLFTSGTTSAPKGVLLTHDSLLRDATATVEAMHWRESDKTCVMVPLFHCFGLTSCLLGSLISGSSLYIMKHFRTVTALEAIQEAGCTVLNGVPSMFLAMIHNRDFDKYDIHTLKSGIIAGSKISPGDYKAICQKLSVDKLQMSYGQTETSPGVSFSGYEDSIEEKCDNAGYLIPGIEACIWDSKKRQHIYPAKDGGGKAEKKEVHGEIGIRGFPVMQGYYQLPEETAAAIESDGWLHTGDLGYFDEKERLHIEGRIKEMIIRGGENISPVEIEECLMELPEIRQVKVVGVPQEIIQEEIGACIELEPGVTLDKEEIISYVKAHLAQYKVPKYIAFFKKLPMNASGKIKIGELKMKMLEIAEEENTCISQNNMN